MPDSLGPILLDERQKCIQVFFFCLLSINLFFLIFIRGLGDATGVSIIVLNVWLEKRRYHQG